jgi:hypothetical protein
LCTNIDANDTIFFDRVQFFRAPGKKTIDRFGHSDAEIPCVIPFSNREVEGKSEFSLVRLAEPQDLEGAFCELAVKFEGAAGEGESPAPYRLLSVENLECELFRLLANSGIFSKSQRCLNCVNEFVSLH